MELSSITHFTKPLVDSFADSSNFRTIAKFAVTRQKTRKTSGFRPRGAAEKEALSSIIFSLLYSRMAFTTKLVHLGGRGEIEH